MFTKSGAGPDKDRIVVFVEQTFHAGDFLTKARTATHVEDVIESSSSTSTGSLKRGICVRIAPPPPHRAQIG